MSGSSVLARLGKSGISVTDIASQYWCERQTELNYIYGKTQTDTMKKGNEIHEELHKPLYVKLEAQPVNYADFLYKVGYEGYSALANLPSKKVAREIMIFGSINGYRLTGQIDELRIENAETVVSETKTKTGGKINSATLSLHKIQVMLYKMMLDDIRSQRYTYKNFYNIYGLKNMSMSSEFKEEVSKLGIGVELDLEGIYKMLFEQLSALPPVSNTLEIDYIDRSSNSETERVRITYDKGELDGIIRHAMGFWNGERESQPVPESEKWKCQRCRFFGKQCKVWWSG